MPDRAVTESRASVPAVRVHGLAWLALLAAAILPGLGHAVLGRPRTAALLLVPVVGLVLAVVIVVGLAPDRASLVGETLSPDVLAVVAVLVAIVGAYRLAVLAATGVLAERLAPTVGRARSARLAQAALLALLVAAPHVAIDAVVLDARETVIAVLAPGGPDEGFGGLLPPEEPESTASPVAIATQPTTTGSASPSATPLPGSSASPSASPTSTPSPGPTPTATSGPGPAWAANGRLDLLLIGSDAGPDRWSLRTDTMILLSVDLASGRAALFGFPRNMVGVPLPAESAGAAPGGRFPKLLNALYVYAMSHPDEFPGGRIRGFRAVGGAIETLAGVHLDGIAVVNLAGFVRLVDAIGGVDITIPEPLHDKMYPLEDGSGLVEIYFPAGRQHLDGQRALMYVRSRHQDSDYGRMERQQAMLLAIRRSLNPCTLIPNIPKLLEIARDDLWTNLSPKDLPSLFSLGARTNTRQVTTILFAPSAYPAYLTDDEIGRIRRVVRTIFAGPAPSPSPTETPDGGGLGPCG
jgi:LCP family protein required for cell wall assembly